MKGAPPPCAPGTRGLKRARDMGPSIPTSPAGGSSPWNAREEYLGPEQLIPRSEYIRLLAQALDELGYADLSQQLQRESVRPGSAFRSSGLIRTRQRTGWHPPDAQAPLP